MEINLPSGKYVVAVSGGVDSMCLLDLLAKKDGLQLIVAHFDHGIRPDSNKDARVVEELAKNHGLKFELGRGQLGAGTSEEKARLARYEYLEAIRTKHKADAVVTAHHQDDLIETVFINLLRGTGQRGAVSLSSSATLQRPLIGYSKKQLHAYARTHKIDWLEDPSNEDTNYLRNYLRLKILPALTASQRRAILANVDIIANSLSGQEELISLISSKLISGDKINRRLFSQLDARVGAEILHSKLRHEGDINKRTIDRLNIAIRTAKPGKRTDIVGSKDLVVDKEFAWVETR